MGAAESIEKKAQQELLLIRERIRQASENREVELRANAIQISSNENVVLKKEEFNELLRLVDDLAKRLNKLEEKAEEQDSINKQFLKTVTEEIAEIVRDQKKREDELRNKLETLKNQKDVNSPSALNNRPVWTAIADIQRRLQTSAIAQKGVEKMLTDICATRNIDNRMVEEIAGSSSESLAPRTFEAEDSILILGGKDASEMSRSVTMLAADSCGWDEITLELPCDLATGGAACLDGEIYIFGGYGSEKLTYKLDKEKNWQRLADMHDGRTLISGSSLAFGDGIWVFGGAAPRGPTNTVKKYLPAENKWAKMPKMHDSRQSAAAAVYSDKIYVCGGWNGNTSNFPLNSVECFDPVSLVWSQFVSMPAPRYGHAAVAFRDSLLVLGGFNMVEDHNTVWKICPSEKEPSWKVMEPMRYPRSYFAAGLMGNLLYVIGGTHNNSVEEFDGETWEPGPFMADSRLGFSSTLIPEALWRKFIVTVD